MCVCVCVCVCVCAREVLNAWTDYDEIFHECSICPQDVTKKCLVQIGLGYRVIWLKD